MFNFFELNSSKKNQKRNPLPPPAIRPETQKTKTLLLFRGNHQISASLPGLKSGCPHFKSRAAKPVNLVD